MKKIHTLPQHIVAQISAGEVLERPAYAVKELVENAIDAHADIISIQIEEAGLKKIVVADNGEGMSEEDLLESFKPHTTSKIKDDLIGIMTLGFRGEALSSIAAVSNLSLQSRLHTDMAGNFVTLQTGKIDNSGPIGMSPGTIATVTNLFHTIPARRKFLKSARTEFRHIIELITQYALVYPHIRFSLMHNNRTFFDLPKTIDITERFDTLLGASIKNQLFPVIANPSYIQVTGSIAHPQIITRTSNRQYIFVNNRAITDKLITNAVKDAYGSLLEPKANPLFLLFLKLPHEMVDVNVHPRKEQVKFVNNDVVFAAVREAIAMTLSENNLTFHNISFNTFSHRFGTTSSHAAKILKKEVATWNVKDMTELLKTSDIIQVHSLYLLMQSPNGFLLIDQHAAHERILYEQFLEDFEKRKKKTFKLKKPHLLDFGISEIELVEEHKDILKELGFDLEPFGSNHFRVTVVPELFKDRDIKLLLIELLEEFSQGKKNPPADYISTTMIAYLACRAAIKAGDKLTKAEAKRLIERLTQTNSPYTCAHGRPTQVEISLDELHLLFKRK